MQKGHRPDWLAGVVFPLLAAALAGFASARRAARATPGLVAGCALLGLAVVFNLIGARKNRIALRVCALLLGAAGALIAITLG